MASAGPGTRDTASLQALLGPQLTAEQAAPIFHQGQEAVVFAPLTSAKQLAQRQAAATTIDPPAPSGQTPPYTKPTAKGRAKPKGAKPGHPGHRRLTPPRIGRREDHTLAACPRCRGPVRPCRSSRARVIEDIPVAITPVVTERTTRRYWCPHRRDTVEPVVTDALPGATIGLRVVALSAWLHDLPGATPAQIIDVFNSHLHFESSAGGPVAMWQRLREVLFAWDLEIRAQALDGAVLHADEAGGRVSGKAHRLRCFTSTDVTCYLIDRSRGSPALERSSKKELTGVSVTDFWGAYNAVVRAQKQRCRPPLLRDIKRARRHHKPEGDWPAFSKQLKRRTRDSLRLSKRRKELPPEQFASRRVGDGRGVGGTTCWRGLGSNATPVGR